MATATLELQTEDVVDARTDSQRIVDAIVGASGVTELDKQFARVWKHASELYLNGKMLRKYLLLGEECDVFVIKATAAGAKRSAVVFRLEELLSEAGLGSTDVRVNDWLAVYGLARCITGVDTVKEMPVEFLSTHAYRTLAILKVAVERDDLVYRFKAGWADKVTELLRTGVRGRNLEVAVKEHGEYVEETMRTNRLKAMTPERAAQEMARENAALHDKNVASIAKAAEGIRDKAIAANVSPEDLLCTLVSRGVIPAPEPIKAPLDGVDMARAMTPELAAQFAKALCDRNEYGIIATIASVLTGHMKAVHAKAAND